MDSMWNSLRLVGCYVLENADVLCKRLLFLIAGGGGIILKILFLPNLGINVSIWAGPTPDYGSFFWIVFKREYYHLFYRLRYNIFNGTHAPILNILKHACDAFLTGDRGFLNAN